MGGRTLVEREKARRQGFNLQLLPAFPLQLLQSLLSFPLELLQLLTPLLAEPPLFYLNLRAWVRWWLRPRQFACRI